MSVVEGQCPVGEIHRTRWRIATALSDVGGIITDDKGKATARLAELVGVRWPNTGLTTLLKHMEHDGEIERQVNGKRTLAIMLTEKGATTFRVPMGKPSESTEAPEPTPEPAPEPVGRDLVDEMVTRLDYRQLAAEIIGALPASHNGHALNGHHHTNGHTNGTGPDEIDELKFRLREALDEGQRWRATAGTLKRQVDELTAKNAELNKKARQARQNNRPKNVELSSLVATAEQAGWEVHHQPGGHLRFQNGKNKVIASSTPSDHRSLLNVRAELRRQGLAC